MTTRPLLFAAIAAAIIPGVCAAQSSRPDDVIIMRRQIVTTPTPAISPPLSDDGVAYAWYSVCSGGKQFDTCLALSKADDIRQTPLEFLDEDDPSCETGQNTLYQARANAFSAVAIRDSIKDIAAITPAGSKATLKCADHVGHGYRCIDLKPVCYSVDDVGWTSEVEASACDRPNPDTRYDAIDKQLGLYAPPVASFCSDAGRFYATQRRCGWIDSTFPRRWGFSGHCYAINPDTGSTVGMSVEACLAKVGTTYSQKDLDLMKGIGMTPVEPGFNLSDASGRSCAGAGVGGDTGALVSTVWSDSTGRLGNCRARRTIVENWSCVDPSSGSEVSDGSCAGQEAQWYDTMSKPFVNMAGTTVSIDRGSSADSGSHTRTTTYDYPSCA